MLLFLVLAVDSDWFQILLSYVHALTQATRSYALLVGLITYVAAFPYPLPDLLLQAIWKLWYEDWEWDTYISLESSMDLEVSFK